MTGKVENKVVLITGTGGGLGRAAAIRFAAEGAKVIGCDLKEEGNRETCKMVREAGGSITTMEPVDLGDPEQARHWVQEAAAVHGRIDILYNNASACRFAPIGDFPLDDWHFTIRNELDLVFYTTRYAWPWLRESRGLIINIGSTAGLTGSGPGGAAHAATKGAVIAFSRHLASECAGDGMRVVCISPGYVDTPGTADFSADPEIQQQLIARNLVPRAGKPEDIAGTALFLASEDASYMTGANVVVDGGRTAW